MPEISPSRDAVKKAIVKTMAFFSLYDLPLHLQGIHQLLYKQQATIGEVEAAIKELESNGKLVRKGELYALKTWDEYRLEANRVEIQKRWKKVDRYFWLFSIIPFIDHLSIINSLAFGNAHQESDIDFFVVTKPGRLYFVRSIIIVLFRSLGVYKTRTKVNEQFCFGFYVASNHQNLVSVLLEGEDPHFAFWFASFAPLINKSGYQRLINYNHWIYEYFPNFNWEMRLTYIKEKNITLRLVKGLLEIISIIPCMILEPILRYIHIRHTFKLPENHWATSSTVANKHMLKLHALDPRKELREKFYGVLQSM